MYETRQFRKGLKIELDGAPYTIVDFQHISPGKGSAFTRTKLKHMISKNTMERTFKSGDVVPEADCEQRQMQFLYKDASGYHFMDLGNYEQTVLSGEQLGDRAGYLQENLEVFIMHYKGRAIEIELPTFIEARVAQTEPSARGDTVTGGSKPAKIDTGATVMVPFHIKEGDRIKVDTRDGSYAEKVNR